MGFEVVFAASLMAACVDPRTLGAKPGGIENHEVNTKAIQEALTANDCVQVSGGEYYIASVNLKTDNTLILDDGASLVATVNVSTVGLVQAQNVKNITIKGSGALDGRCFDLIDYYSPGDNRFQPIYPDGNPYRPILIYMSQVEDIVLQDIFLKNSSRWNIHLQGCHRILVDNVDVEGDSRWPNNDGFDPESCTDVIVQHSRFNVADDGICPKADSNYGPVRNLYVYNCTIRSKSHAIKFGSNTDTDMHDIVFDHITIWDSNSGMAIQQRSGGNIYNVTWSNIKLETRLVAPRWWGNGEWLSITSEKRSDTQIGGLTYDLKFINITGRSENTGLLSGRSHPEGVKGVSFEHVHITIDKWGNYSNGVRCNSNLEGAIPCMASADYRPSDSYSKICGGNCRTPLPSLIGLYLVNAHNVSFNDMQITYSPAPMPMPAYWGNQTCFAQDKDSTASFLGTTCNKRK